ncbi:2-oxo acid dehydrogenase subunit E2 [Sphingopyxis sp. JAI128]|uniref:2-oxo acid dehydrogenase subunit E2 n=1 Tax=Sphingopyxis sp. JAI128 TaxID=2723066 RepID=UPI00160A4217|nr:2-oxo acid dehydrogenase subunit E2 [Sphingopyxis sp. JAI128]MBB6427850.1 pyruvate dehydrogenase E2 component (dihydrolipoamide acetyltransferase) [Sphingopyxis sp. JAI128]
MATELTMPALSPTMEKGTLAKWLVKEGDAIKAGDLIAEIETDKATMEYEAAADGRIARLVIAEGTDDVAVGAVIALLASGDEAAPELAMTDVVPTEAPAVARAEIPPTPAPVAQPVAPAPEPMRKRPSPADRIKVSPLAARIADAKGIDLEAIAGSGPNGRIVRADLGVASLLAIPAGPVATAVIAAPEIAPPPAGVPVESVKLGSMRRMIARRLTESKTSVPHFYLTARCNLDPLLALRGQLNAALEGSGVKLSVNDLLIKALAFALQEVPDANVQFGGEMLHRFGRVDVSMAVAIDGGLVTPVLRDVGAKSLSAIATESKALAAKARDGKLVPDDSEGGTVSLSNLGMFGIDEIMPVINPPQALILGTAAGIEQPWKVDGGIKLATIMAATASFDHRAVDGATGAEFLRSFKTLVENPLRIAA